MFTYDLISHTSSSPSHHQIEPVEDALNRDVGIYDYLLSGWKDFDSRFCVGVLFGYQYRYVSLDASGANTDDDHGDDESDEGHVILSEGGWNGREHQH